MKSNNVSNTLQSGLMSKGEWSRKKASYQNTGIGISHVANYDTYEEYLNDYVTYANKKKTTTYNKNYVRG